MQNFTKELVDLNGIYEKSLIEINNDFETKLNSLLEKMQEFVMISKARKEITKNKSILEAKLIKQDESDE